MTYTLQQAQDKAKEIDIKPSTILLHCGTNDLEKRNNKVVYEESISLLKHMKNKFPSAKIIFYKII